MAWDFRDAEAAENVPRGQCNFRAGARIFRGVVMAELDAQMRRHVFQAFGRKLRPDAARDAQGAEKIHARGRQIVGAHAAVEDALVEACIVRQHQRAVERVVKLRQHIGEFRRGFHVLGCNTVTPGEGEISVARSDKPLLDPSDAAILDPGKAYLTGVAWFGIGGFEIDGDDFHAASLAGDSQEAKENRRVSRVLAYAPIPKAHSRKEAYF